MKPIYIPKGKAKEYGDYVVYMHTFPNGKRYIGISRNVARRFRNGRGYEHQPVMWGAIQKYGWHTVKTIILLESLTETEAKAEEIKLIAKYNTADRTYGYNQTLGGEGGNGRVLSDEEKQNIGKRMSLIHKGVPLSEEHKKKLSTALKGKPKELSESGRQAIIKSNKSRIYSDETRQKMSQNTKLAMKEKGVGEYLSKKWAQEKEIRKAKMRLAMYDRYGVFPKNHDLRDDVALLGLFEDYEEMDFGDYYIKDSLRAEMERGKE